MTQFKDMCRKFLASWLAFVMLLSPAMPLVATLGSLLIVPKVLAYDGCMDPAYLEYDPGADNDPGGFCITLIVLGCTNPAYLEYNPAANTDDGSCMTLIPTPPTLSTATVNATTLTLTYNATLDIGSVPFTNDFVVNVNSSPVAISSVNVIGTTVVLTLAANAGSGTTVTLDYTVPGSNPIQDEAGDDAVSLSGQSVTNITETTPPTLSNAVVNVTTLTLTYNEVLDSGSIPATNDFVINVNGSPVSKSSVNVIGSTVVVTLSATVGSGTTVTINYTPGGSPIQDEAGNNAGSLGGQSATNNTADIVAPILSTAIVDGTTLTLTYNEALDSGSAPATSDFVVNVNGSPMTISSVSISDVTVVVTLATNVGIGTTVTINYTVPVSNPTQDLAGNDAASLIGGSVTNNTGNTPPILLSATVANTILTLNYDEALDSGSIPATSDFVVNVNGSPVSKSSVNVGGAIVIITLSANVSLNNTVTLNYIPGWSPIQDEWGSDAASLSGESVTNITPNGIPVGWAPLFSSASGTKVYVNNNNSHTVSVIDTTTDTVIATIPVWTSPIFSSVSSNKVYVSNTASSDVSVIDTTTDTVVATIPVWTSPDHSSAVGTKVYVSNTGSHTVSVIDTTTDTVIATIPVGSTPNYSTIVGTKVYVNNYNGSTVSVIDSTTDTVVATIPVWSIVYSSSVVGTKIYVSNTGSHTVSVIDTTTDTVIATIPVWTSPYPSSVVGTKVYVVNNVSNTISVIDSTTDTVVATIPVGLVPYSSSVVGTKIYVSNTASSDVSVIDSTTDTVVATIAAGLSLGSSSVGTKVYVNNYSNNVISVIDTATDTLVKVYAPRLTSITSTSSNGNYSTGQSINIKAQFNEALWASSTIDVTLSTGDVVTLTRISPGDDFLTGTYTVGAGDVATDLTVTSISNASVSDTDSIPNTQTSYSPPSSPDLSSDPSLNLGDLKNLSIGWAYCSVAVGTNPYQMTTVGTLNYTANMGSDDVSVINTVTNTVTDTISVGDRPYGLAYNSTTKELYIANLGDNTVSVIDADPAHAGTTFKTVTNTINVGVEPYYVASLGTNIYVTNNISNTVSVIDTSTHSVTDTVGVGNAPRGIKVHGTNLYVANYGSGGYGSAPTVAGTVSVIDSLTNTVTDTITVGVGPRGVTILANEVYVANFEDDTVSVIATATNTVTHTISVGNTPRGIFSLGTNVYVENYQAGTVSVINSITHAVTNTVAVGNTPAGFTAIGTDLYISRFTDNVVSIFDTLTNTLKATCTADSTPPTFTMQFYSDVGLTTPIADNSTLIAGTYYIKISADEALTATPTISIATEWTANDITNGATTLVSGNDYTYTYIISSDVLAVGTVLADFSVTGTDLASNTATNVSPTNEATKAIYTDTVADAATWTPDMTAGTDTGSSNSDDITSDTTPDFAISCVTGSVVTLYDNVTSIGSWTCAGSTVTITSSVLTAGTHATINATQTDTAGNISAASGNLSVVIDTTADGATGTPDLTAGTDTGSSSTDNITNDTTPNFTISCVTGSVVTLYDNVTSIGTGTCAGSTVTITSSALSEATHPTINATQTDTAGNISVASSNLSIVIDTTVPVFSAANVNGSTLTMTYSEILDNTSTPASGDFIVLVNAAPVVVSSVTIAGTSVILTLSSAVTAGQSVTVSYTPWINPLRDSAANNALFLTSQVVTNTTSGGGGGGGGGGSSGLFTIQKTPLTSKKFTPFDLDKFLAATFPEEDKPATRRDTLALGFALHGGSLEQEYVCKNRHTDTSWPDVPTGTCQLVEKSQDADLISKIKTTFRPLNSVSRIEAYSIMMKSVCIHPETNADNWKTEVMKKAMELGFTVRNLKTFQPDRPLTTSEMYAVVGQINTYKKTHPESCKT